MTALLIALAALGADVKPIDYQTEMFIRLPEAREAKPDRAIRTEKPGLIVTLDLRVVSPEAQLLFDAPTHPARKPCPAIVVRHKMPQRRGPAVYRYHLLTGIDKRVNEGDRMKGEFYIAASCRSSGGTGRVPHFILKPIAVVIIPEGVPVKTLWELSEELKAEKAAKAKLARAEPAGAAKR